MQAPPQDRERGARLRRRATGRVIAGVAGGLADAWGLGTAGVRVAFAACAGVAAWFTARELTDPYGTNALTPFTAVAFLGVVAYVGLWASVPREDRTDSPFGRIGRRFPGLPSWTGVVLFGLGTALLGAELGLWRTNVVWAMLLIGAGVLLFRHDARPRTTDPPAAVVTADAPSPVAPVVVESTVVRERRRPRERSPLGWLTFGAELLIVGGAAIMSNVGAIELRLQQFPALGLLVLSVGLLVAAFVGRARWLILPSLLLVPALLAASLIHVPLESGYGDLWLGADGRDPSGTYRRVVGRVNVDLMSLRGSDERVQIAATTGVGDISVGVPYDALVLVRARSALGDVSVGSTLDIGFDAVVDRRWEPRVEPGPVVVLDLESGIGRVSVYREWLTKRERKELRREGSGRR